MVRTNAKGKNNNNAILIKNERNFVGINNNKKKTYL